MIRPTKRRKSINLLPRATPASIQHSQALQRPDSILSLISYFSIVSLSFILFKLKSLFFPIFVRNWHRRVNHPVEVTDDQNSLILEFEEKENLPKEEIVEEEKITNSEFECQFQPPFYDYKSPDLYIPMFSVFIILLSKLHFAHYNNFYFSKVSKTKLFYSLLGKIFGLWTLNSILIHTIINRSKLWSIKIMVVEAFCYCGYMWTYFVFLFFLKFILEMFRVFGENVLVLMKMIFYLLGAGGYGYFLTKSLGCYFEEELVLDSQTARRLGKRNKLLSSIFVLEVGVFLVVWNVI